MSNENVQWMWGHPRDWAKASRCKHFDFASFANLQPVQEKSPIEGAPPKNKLVLQGIPALATICKSPELNASLARQTKAPEDISLQWKMTLVNRDVCSLCPHWEPRDGD